MENVFVEKEHVTRVTELNRYSQGYTTMKILYFDRILNIIGTRMRKRDVITTIFCTFWIFLLDAPQDSGRSVDIVHSRISSNQTSVSPPIH